ncbi:MAG: DUF6445 family protein [Henriciella sp.]|uniref:DUF6445 family protein n=1 Tax=Henriciella sp. TaxID=1968823 RepID=UPI003C76914B
MAGNTGQQAPSARVYRIGRGAHPVLVIEQAVPGAETLIGAASQLNFSRCGPFYPGIRAPAPPAYTDVIGRAYGELICKVFGWQNEGMQPMEADFSLVTTPPGELVRYQRLPHIDGTSPDTIAVLHYLCGPEKGGTGFFRHKATGLEALSDETHQTYTDALETELSELGEPPQTYPGASAHYDEVARFDCVFNRMLIYRGNLLHSGLIPDDMPLSDDPARGRLTLNSFFRRGPQRA